MRSVFLVLLLIAVAFADVYMHNPRGSNNRWHRDRANDPNNRQTENNERLFDSQNNNNGGYDWGEGKMKYYEGSYLGLEWTNQHGCGTGVDQKNECEIIWQYTCGHLVRDGSTTDTIPDTEAADVDLGYGRHESWFYYQKCKMRQRNMGLFLADQDQEIEGDSAIYTRQNPNGNNNGNNPHGFECPEERDYYPYWQWSPWVDIVVLTTDTSRCEYYQSNSQNVQGRGYCQDSQLTDDGWMFINEATCRDAGFDWIPAGTDGMWEAQSWTDRLDAEMAGGQVPPPDCIEAPWSRQNSLGNVRQGTQSGMYYSGIDNAIYNWTIPSYDLVNDIFRERSTDPDPAMNCVVRIRYNMSSTDYDGWNTDAASNGKMLSSVINNPWADYGWNFLLRLAIDTTQFARTFQDRSHVFSILKRDLNASIPVWENGIAASNVADPTWTPGTPISIGPNTPIHNLNVVGRRGNIVQTYPAEQYGFRPRIVRMSAGSLLHPQWTGTHHATVDAWGEGQTSTDMHSLVQIPSLKENWPVDFETEQTMFEPATAWRLAFAGIYDDNGNEDTRVLSTTGVQGGESVCYSQAQLERLYRDENNAYEMIRTDSRNCQKLSGLRTPYFDGGLIAMANPGTYYAMDARNNVAGQRSTKVTIVVE